MNAPTCRDRTDRLRAIPLVAILRAIDAQPDPHDPAKWHTPRGVISVNGAKFFNWNEAKGGGGAIDLTMHLRGMRFKEAIGWLAKLPTTARTGLDERRAAHVPRPLVLPMPVPEALPEVITYLDEQRRLPRQRLLALIASADLYADRHRNAVFLLRNEHGKPVGAELRGTGNETWRGMAPGSRKNNGYFALGPHPFPQAIVLCESAIDAISCHTKNPQCRCISTTGARANPAWMPRILESNIPVYCGFDNDPAGNAMADAMITLYPLVQRLQPPSHDWNDALAANP